MDEIEPVFRDLASEDLLKKCLHGRTQNTSESVNSLDDVVLLGCDAMWTHRQIPTFRRNILSQSSIQLL
jgi:hypothetical protein